MNVVKAVFRNLWTALKFIGRWLGPALILLAAYNLAFPRGPFGDGAAVPALAGGIISAIAWFAGRKWERLKSKWVLLAAAVGGLAYFGFSMWNGSRGYTTETVSFDNRGARLVGTLYLPERKDPDRQSKVPGIVWVHGAGPLPRGFLTDAAHYARKGYAILLYDKRGIGDSTGQYEQRRNTSPQNIDLLASDASAALALLARRPEVRADSVGFLGCSQAGWIVPRAAVMNGKAAFVLLLSGPTTSVHTQMRYEIFHVGDTDRQSALATLMNVFVSTRGNIPKGLTPDQADVLAQKARIAFDYGDTDPMIDLRALNIPGLWLLGNEDYVVPSGPTARILDTLRREGKPYEFLQIPGADHCMNVAPKKLTLDTIDTWLARVTAEKR